MIGSGIGGLPGIESESIVRFEKGPRRVSPHFVHGRLINLISGQVSIKYGLRGPNHAVVTACSTGAHAIGDAARIIAADDADISDKAASHIYRGIFYLPAKGEVGILALESIDGSSPVENVTYPPRGVCRIALVTRFARMRRVAETSNRATIGRPVGSSFRPIPAWRAPSA